MNMDEFLEQTSTGVIFGVTFIKRTTGEVRKMQCRRRVSKGVKGVGLAFKPEEKDLLTVFDMNKVDPRNAEGQKGAFRSIPLDALQEVRLRGKVYSFDPVKRELIQKD